jgi:type II secretory pathway pseudopilin PulG
MFQLIVAVISIALVAALALASIFYGGEAFTRGQLKAQVTTMINQAQQISGANTLYKNDKGGVDATSIPTDLVSPVSGVKYLTADITPPSKITTGGAWGIDAAAGTVYVAIDPTADAQGKVTDAVNEADVGEISNGFYYFPL